MPTHPATATTRRQRDPRPQPAPRQTVANSTYRDGPGNGGTPAAGFGTAQPRGDSPDLTLKDRLSRLTYREACKLLGDDADRLMRKGGEWEINIDDQTYLGDDLFRLSLPEATVTITPMAQAPKRLHWNCTACDNLCEHVGAAFSLVLEEKTALGLAVPPPEERIPIESLDEATLIKRALDERRERAKTERMTIRPVDAEKLWTDYLVTNKLSGRTYRVALRGWEAGESYCSCPDFRKNTLGVCKHIFRVHARVRAKFTPAQRNRPYRQKDISVHLHYGPDTELRLLLPDRFDDEAAATILKPITDQPITDVPDLVGRIRKLAKIGHDVTLYPDAEEYINHRLFIESMRHKTADIRRDPRTHPLRKALLKAELLPYQLDGIAFAVGAGRAILADEMGLGKTIQGIGVAELLSRETSISKVLVVCPTTLKSQWRNEINRFSDRTVQLVTGPAAQRTATYAKEAFFTICNYEQVLRDILSIEQIKWDLIILDEGQRIKNWEAKTSGIIKSLRSPFALVLTGTPLENRLDDLFSIIEFLDDRRLGPAFRFFNRHRITDERGKVLGYKNITELRERLKPVLLRRTRASVMQELPGRSTEIVRIAPTGEQSVLHDNQMRIVASIVVKKFLTEMDLLRLQKALLMCRMSADSTFLVNKDEPGYSTKLDRLDDLLGDLLQEPDRKIILFSEWTTMLGLIEPLIKNRNAEYVRLDGSVPQKQRQMLVNTFQKDPKCRLFITTNAGSTGLNLQAANTVINVDLPWNPAILEQRIARAHRMGQKRPVQVFVLVTEQTIEESLLKTLSLKHDLALAALDPESDVDQVDLCSGINELKQRLEILLGKQPAAPLDESQKTERSQEAQRFAPSDSSDTPPVKGGQGGGVATDTSTLTSAPTAGSEETPASVLTPSTSTPASQPTREKLATAGGHLLTAAFTFLGELLPAQAPTDQSRQLAAAMKDRLAECLEPTDDGQLKLTLSLPNAAALDNIAQSLARLLSASQ